MDKKLILFLLCVAVGVILYFIPAPEGLAPNAWKFFAIFLAVVLGLVLEPIPPALVGLIGVVVAGGLMLVFKAAPGTTEATPAQSVAWILSGFNNTVIWLIFVAFMFAKGYEKSGLGKRIALIAVKLLGRKSLGLGYAISIADLSLAPFTPSNTARSGGTIYPIISNIPPLYQSLPNDESRKKIGAYIMWVAISTTCITSSMFITSLAPNLLALNLANTTISAEMKKKEDAAKPKVAPLTCQQQFETCDCAKQLEKCEADVAKKAKEDVDKKAGITPAATPKPAQAKPLLTWTQWMMAFLPVGAILFLLNPILGYIFYKPQITSNDEVPKWAGEELKKMGGISKNEVIMGLSALLALTMWIFGKEIFGGIDGTAAAMVVLCILLITKVISWDDVIGNKAAWNVLVWFATLVALASGLNTVGFLSWFANIAGHWLEGYSVNTIIIGLTLLFFFIHYFFASVTAHVTALVPIFIVLAMGVSGLDINVAAVMMLLTLGIMGVITPYATGPSPVYFGSGYISSKEFWTLGAIFGVIYIAVMILVGFPWVSYYMGTIAGQ